MNYQPCRCAWWACFDHYAEVYDRWQTIVQERGNDLPMCTHVAHRPTPVRKILWHPLA